MPVDKVHQSFPETCESCYTTKDWESVYINHDTLVSTQTCIECHKKPEDNLHTVASGDCISCHNTLKWKSATFAHDNYFPLTGDHYVSCETCHPDGNYKQYTCLNCHEHNTSHIRHEHEEHGIHNYGDCLRCHRFKINGKRYGIPKAETSDDDEYSDDDSD
jgi:formate dehydrogenase maturation protein FdhE